MGSTTQENGKKRKKLIRKLKKHYRLVIMNDDNFELKASLKLTPLNVLFVVSVLSILFATVIISLLVATPLREYFIPNDDLAVKQDLVASKARMDSINRALEQELQYQQNLMNILTGNIDTSRQEYETEEIFIEPHEIANVGQQDSLLRAEMESNAAFGILTGIAREATRLEEFHFFPPVTGIVSNQYDDDVNHYGVDIVARQNTPIKATLDGKVIFTGWTAEDGYVIAIQHPMNLISIYKHNSVLLKKTGNQVQAGDVVAIIGNTGELSQGPHLHFELWHNMIPINPVNFINFN